MIWGKECGHAFLPLDIPENGFNCHFSMLTVLTILYHRHQIQYQLALPSAIDIAILGNISTTSGATAIVD